jgi:hypothetical protein
LPENYDQEKEFNKLITTQQKDFRNHIKLNINEYKTNLLKADGFLVHNG